MSPSQNKPGLAADPQIDPQFDPDHRARGPIDGVLLVSFGGPRGPQDVLPFLERVTAGRGVPTQRLMEVAQHYYRRVGVSPINDETQAQARALQEELRRAGGAQVPVFIGNRNWDPLLADALRQAIAAGCAHLAVVLTSAYSGYSSCRQYRENLADACAEVAAAGLVVPQLSFVPAWGLAPPIIQAWVTRGVDSLTRLAARSDPGGKRHLLYVAHSIPEPAAHSAGPPGAAGAYVRELQTVAEQVADGIHERMGAPAQWSLAYCSRSGRPGSPWLEPDVCDALAHLRETGVQAVSVLPIGFVADHMEVVEDLDTQAAQHAAELGLGWDRAPTLRDDVAVAGHLAKLALAAGDHPGFCPARCCPGGPATAPARRAAFEGAPQGEDRPRA